MSIKKEKYSYQPFFEQNNMQHLEENIYKTVCQTVTSLEKYSYSLRLYSCFTNS